MFYGSIIHYIWINIHLHLNLLFSGQTSTKISVSLYIIKVTVVWTFFSKPNSSCANSFTVTLTKEYVDLYNNIKYSDLDLWTSLNRQLIITPVDLLKMVYYYLIFCFLYIGQYLRLKRKKLMPSN